MPFSLWTISRRKWSALWKAEKLGRFTKQGFASLCWRCSELSSVSQLRASPRPRACFIPLLAAGMDTLRRQDLSLTHPAIRFARQRFGDLRTPDIELEVVVAWCSRCHPMEAEDGPSSFTTHS